MTHPAELYVTEQVTAALNARLSRLGARRVTVVDELGPWESNGVFDRDGRRVGEVWAEGVNVPLGFDGDWGMAEVVAVLFDSTDPLFPSITRDMEYACCDHCGGEWARKLLHGFDQLPIAVNSANEGESALLCEYCAHFVRASPIKGHP